MSSSTSDPEDVEASLHAAVADFFKSEEGTVLVSTQVIEHLHSKKGKALLSQLVESALDTKPAADPTPRKDKKKPTKSSKSVSPAVQKIGRSMRRSKRARVHQNSSDDDDDDDTSSLTTVVKDEPPAAVAVGQLEDPEDVDSDEEQVETSTKYLSAISAHEVPPIFKKWDFINKCSDGKNAQEWPVSHYDTLRKGAVIDKTLQVTEHLERDVKVWEKIAYKKAGVAHKKALRPSERLYVRVRLLAALVARKRNPLRGAAALVLTQTFRRSFKYAISNELETEIIFYEGIIKRYIVKS